MNPLGLLSAIPAERLVRVGIALAFALCFFLIGMGVHKTFADRKMAKAQAAWAQERLLAQTARADAEEHAREVERKWLARTAQMESTYVDALRQRDRIVRDLAVAGDGLRNRLKSIVQASSTAATSSTTCRDVHKRVEALGVLLGEADGLAEESGRAADELRDELALCRTYAQTVSKQD